jgi:cytosine/adenosine deaminase-related metal-dependent hydrolase
MTAPRTTRIRGGVIVAFDAARGGHELLEGGEVVFRGDRIVHVGARYLGHVDEEIDASGAMVIPGLIDAHALIDVGIHTLLWDRPRDEGYRTRAFMEDTTPPFTPEQLRDGARAMMSMMLRSGVTTIAGINAMVFKRFHDDAHEPPLYASVANELGLRAYLSHHYRSSVPIVADPSAKSLVSERLGMEGLARSVEFARRAAAGEFGPRIHALLFPYTQDTVSDDLLRATRAAADELGVGWRMHFAQSRHELDDTLARTGRTPVERLFDLGVLGPDVILTHTMYGRGHPASRGPQGAPGLSDAELAMLAQTGTNVGHTPWIYLWGGRVLDAFGRYRRAGVNVAIGTDTYPGDMLQEMRIAALMGKVAEQSGTAATAADAFDAATLGGARALGRDDLGRIAPGAKADLAIVRRDRATFAPTLDPIRSLVYYATIRDVDSVWVDGRRVLAEGVVPGVDEADVMRRMNALVGDVASLLQRLDPLGRSVDERWGSAYPRRNIGG